MPDTTHTENDLREALVRRSLDGGAEPDVTDFRARLATLLASPDAADGSIDRAGEDAPVTYLSPMITEPEPAGPSAERTAGTGAVFDLIPRTERGTRRGSRRRVGYLAVAAAACVALGGAGIVALRGNHGGTGAPAATRTPATHIPASVPEQVRDGAYPGTQYVAGYSGTGSRTVTVTRRTVPENYQWSASFSCTGKATSVSLGDEQLMDKDLCHAGTYDGGSVDPAGGSLRVDIAKGVRWQLWLFLAPTTRSNGAVTKGQPEAIAVSSSSSYSTASGETGPDGAIHVPSPRRLMSASGLTISIACTGTGVRITGFTPDYVHGDAYTDTCFEGFVYQWTTTKVGQTMTLHVQASGSTTWRLVVTG